MITIRKLDEFGQEQKNAHAETLKALAGIGNNVQKMLSMMEKERQSQSEIMTAPLHPSYAPFQANGYKFNSLYVSDDQAAASTKLVINVFGANHTITLSAGENIVNIPDGAQISVTNTNNAAQSFLLQRFNYLKQ